MKRKSSYCTDESKRKEIFDRFNTGIPIEALSDSYHINKGVIEKIVTGSYKPPAPKGSSKRE